MLIYWRVGSNDKQKPPENYGENWMVRYELLYFLSDRLSMVLACNNQLTNEK